MRNTFCQAMLKAASDESMVFLTGDLGFNALEPLREKMGQRFINAGVAEQNMISVAAGLAKSGLQPWTYSIAPFIYARPFEQIRNDVCLHDLPVRMVGNGGGYGYGVMGASHHALEDFGVMATLQNLRAYVPAFACDVAPIVNQLTAVLHPAYLRLGLTEEPSGMSVPSYAPWRKVVSGRGITLLGIGPVIAKIIAAARELPELSRPSIWVVTELPLEQIPVEFINDVRGSGHLMVVEEHVPQGGLGQMITHTLMSDGVAIERFSHRCAQGYPSGRYGSQAFHRKECGLDAAAIIADVREAAGKSRLMLRRPRALKRNAA